MCAVIQVNWTMTSKCRFLLDVRDGAPVIAGKWHSVGGSVVPEAKGQGGVGEH